MSNTKLKELPYSTTKCSLLQMYGDQMADNYIRKEINLIIISCRGLPTNETPQVKKISHREFMEFVDIHGLPKGYSHSIIESEL